MHGRFFRKKRIAELKINPMKSVRMMMMTVAAARDDCRAGATRLARAEARGGTMARVELQCIFL
jgi:hypothetical protein